MINREHLQEDINSTIKKLNENISISEKQKSFIKALDWEKPVSEDTWHMLCETPLRHTDSIAILLQNTFPEGENFNIESNYITFYINYYKVYIPFTENFAIYINRSVIPQKPIPPMNHFDIPNLEAYYELKHEHKYTYWFLNWYEMVSLRLIGNYSKPKAFFLWFFKCLWKDDKEQEYIAKKEESKKIYDKKLQQYFKNVEAYNFQVNKYNSMLARLHLWTSNVYWLNTTQPASFLLKSHALKEDNNE